jgi:hypothetical protein
MRAAVEAGRIIMRSGHGCRSFLMLETLRNNNTSGWTVRMTRCEIRRLLATETCVYCYYGSRIRSPQLLNGVILASE